MGNVRFKCSDCDNTAVLYYQKDNSMTFLCKECEIFHSLEGNDAKEIDITKILIWKLEV